MNREGHHETVETRKIQSLRKCTIEGRASYLVADPALLAAGLEINYRGRLGRRDRGERSYMRPILLLILLSALVSIVLPIEPGPKLFVGAVLTFLALFLFPSCYALISEAIDNAKVNRQIKNYSETSGRDPLVLK